jgi:putative DNA primase/helicase
LQEHNRDDYITKVCPVNYNPKAKCPLWLAFLERVLKGNKRLIAYLQGVVGYCLTGDVTEHCMWFFFGAGRNGKSTVLSTLRAVMGDYACQVVPELLVVKNPRNPPHGAHGPVPPAACHDD